MDNIQIMFFKVSTNQKMFDQGVRIVYIFFYIVCQIFYLLTVITIQENINETVFP